MKKLLLIAIAALFLFGMPVATKAVLPTACGGTWVYPGTMCEFAFNGGPLKVFGWADAANSPATAFEITLELKSDPTCGAEWCVPLTGCAEAHTTGAKGCEQTFDLVPPLPDGTVLQCRVRGLTAGQYKCSSGPQP